MLGSSADVIGRLVASVVQPAVLVLFSLALLIFFYGIFEFVRGAENTEAQNTGKRHMLWGIVGLFIMVGSYGILQIIVSTFQLDKPVSSSSGYNIPTQQGFNYNSKN